MTKVGLAAIGYVVIVFPLALGWHIGLFEAQYKAFGYFDGAPNLPLGFLTIVLQGGLLAAMYPLFQTARTEGARAFRYCALMGGFFWTSHVLALMAKQNVPNAGGYVLMETGYLALQFGLFAIVLWLLYRRPA